MEKTLLFIEDAYYNGKLAFKKGEIVVLDDKLGFATRWLSRRKAEIYTPKISKEEEKELKEFLNTEIEIEEIVEAEQPPIEEIAIESEVVENKKSKKVKKKS